MATNYTRSRNREYYAIAELSKEGFFAFRTAGSHSFADVVGIKPSDCGYADHFIVRFVQIKVSENRVSTTKEIKVTETPIGMVNIEFWKFPVITKKYRDKMKKKKEKLQRKKVK